MNFKEEAKRIVDRLANETEALQKFLDRDLTKTERCKCGDKAKDTPHNPHNVTDHGRWPY